MNTSIWLAGLAWLGLGMSSAPAFTLELPGAAERIEASYRCSDGAARAVEYVNAGSQSFALMEVEGERRLFVQLLAASGVRYGSASLIWWTKGDTASFSDERSEAAPIACTRTGEVE